MNKLFVLSVALSMRGVAAAEMTVDPQHLTNGQISLLCVDKSAEAKVFERKVVMFASPNTKSHCGFVPVPIEQKAGKLDVDVSWNENGTSKTKKVTLFVKEGTYSESKLRVDPRLTKLSHEDQKRIERDQKDIAEAYAKASATPKWREIFELPIRGAITSQYGNKRSFNGTVTSWHQGVDLRAATGDPVYAANVGRVIFAKETLLAGNTVIVDHGGGICTSYAHLSKISVKVGQDVARGEKLGAAGATGRVTGPHLHWGARVNGTLVDPHHMLSVFNPWWTAQK